MTPGKARQTLLALGKPGQRLDLYGIPARDAYARAIRALAEKTVNAARAEPRQRAEALITNLSAAITLLNIRFIRELVALIESAADPPRTPFDL